MKEEMNLFIKFLIRELIIDYIEFFNYRKH